MSMSQGWDSLDADVKQLAEERAKKLATRFRVKAGESRTVIFLDDLPTVVEEYVIEGADWKDKEYVSKPAGRDRFREAGLKPTKMYFWSILDVTKDKDGKATEFKRLLAVKADQAKLLKDKAQNWQGLLHKPVKISRSGQYSPSSGSDFELILVGGQVTKVDVKKYKDAKPFDYAVVLAPPADDECIRLLAKSKHARSSGESVSLGDDAPPPSDGDFGGAPSAPSAPAGEVDGSNSDIPF